MQKKKKVFILIVIPRKLTQELKKFTSVRSQYAIYSASLLFQESKSLHFANL